MTPLELFISLLFVGLCLATYWLFQQKVKNFESLKLDLNEKRMLLERDLALSTQKAESLQQQMLQKEVLFQTQTDTTLKRQDAEKDLLKKEFTSEKSKLLDELGTERQKISELEKRLENALVTFKNQEEKLIHQSKDLEQLQQKFKIEFENIANKLLEEKSIKFTEQNKNNLDAILNPLKERIKDFEEKVDKTYKAESNERVSLKTQIENLTQLNQQLNEGAANLTKALKGENKTQGNWGEMILEKILEYSGLTKGIEYETQVTYKNQSNERVIPDVIINLPDKKHLIIDAKVSLLAYNQIVNAASEEEAKQFKTAHIASIKNHIKNLSDKKYETLDALNAPDFVLLFLPIESSFAMAVQADNDLFEYAWERRIVLVSPSTLLATLRTIAATWKQEKQTKNALEIAKEAGNMLDKFTNFVGDLTEIGKQIDKSKQSYEEAYKKLATGKGNLINRAKRIQELGAKSDKIKLIDDGEDENTIL